MNRVLAHTGAHYPIVQAPMGWIARSQLASAVCKAGGPGIIDSEPPDLDIKNPNKAALGVLRERPAQPGR